MVGNFDLKGETISKGNNMFILPFLMKPIFFAKSTVCHLSFRLDFGDKLKVVGNFDLKGEKISKEI